MLDARITVQYRYLVLCPGYCECAVNRLEFLVGKMVKPYRFKRIPRSLTTVKNIVPSGMMSAKAETGLIFDLLLHWATGQIHVLSQLHWVRPFQNYRNSQQSGQPMGWYCQMADGWST